MRLDALQTCGLTLREYCWMIKNMLRQREDHAPYLGRGTLIPQVYAIDLLGFGASDKAAVEYSMELWRDQVGVGIKLSLLFLRFGIAMRHYLWNIMK